MHTQHEKTLRINNLGDLASLHPHTGIDMTCRNFQKSLFEALTRVGPDGKPHLAAASELSISPSQLEYTFTLRPMQWTNGEEVRAEHFENAWKAALAPDSSCLRPEVFYVVKNAQRAKKGEISLDQVGVKAVDARTLKVTLEHPTPYFLDLVANSFFCPLYDDAPTPEVFNGPFSVETWEHDKKLVLAKNPTYWDADAIALEKIEVSLVNDSTTATLMYEKGELDWVGHPFTPLPLDMIEKAEHSSDFTQKPITGVYMISLNTEVFPLNSVKIRKALSIALDREQIARHVAQGQLPSKCVVPTTMDLVAPDALYQESEREAKKLFEEGLAELKLTRDAFPVLQYSYSTVPGQKKLAEAIQQRWEQTFGIQVELTVSEWNTFFANLGQRNYQIGGCVWYSVYNDPMYMLEMFTDKTHRYNTAQWESKHYQELIALAVNETDPTLRREHLKQAELLLLDEMPMIPLYVVRAKYLKSPRVENLLITDLGQADFKWCRVKEEALAP